MYCPKMRGKIDVEDVILSLIFSIGALVSADVATITLFGESLTSTALTAGGTDIPWSAVMSGASLAGAYATNKPDFKRLDQVETAAAGGTLVLVTGIAFVPGVESFVTSNDFIGLTVATVETAGFYVMSYRG